MYKVIVTAAAFSLLTGCASSNDKPSDQAGQNGGNSQVVPAVIVSDQDRSFVHDAAIGGMAEVQAGQMAQQQGSSDQIRAFGQHMVADHSKANDELKQIAVNKGISVPTDLDAKSQAEIDGLNKSNGSKFDRAYVTGQLADHKMAVDVFQREANSGQDADLKAFAARTLPTLQHHLEMCQQLPGAMANNSTANPPQEHNDAGNMGGTR